MHARGTMCAARIPWSAARYAGDCTSAILSAGTEIWITSMFLDLPVSVRRPNRCADHDVGARVPGRALTSFSPLVMKSSIDRAIA